MSRFGAALGRCASILLKTEARKRRGVGRTHSVSYMSLKFFCQRSTSHRLIPYAFFWTISRPWYIISHLPSPAAVPRSFPYLHCMSILFSALRDVGCEKRAHPSCSSKKPLNWSRQKNARPHRYPSRLWRPAYRVRVSINHIFITPQKGRKEFPRSTHHQASMVEIILLVPIRRTFHRR